jgi:hypothetical protein
LAPVVADILDDANTATKSRASLKQKAQIAKHKELFAKETAMNLPPFSIKIEKSVDPSSSGSVKQQKCNDRHLQVILQWQQQGTQKGPEG